jgi:hypothetical protein
MATLLAQAPAFVPASTNAHLLSSIAPEGTGIMELPELRRRQSSVMEWEMMFPVFNEEK